MPPYRANARHFPISFLLPVFLLSMLPLSVSLLSGCGGGDEARAPGAAGSVPPGPGGPEGPGKSVPVAVAEVAIGDASSYYTSTASLEAESLARVLARTTGVVRDVLKEEGDLVEADQVLIRLEDDGVRQRVKQAEANLASARSEHVRRARMRDGGLLSDEEFETTENTLRVREAELELARLELAYTRVSSPFHGQVVRRLVDLGTHVTPGTPLFDVMDINPLLARVHIPAKRMGFIEVGQAIELSLESTGQTLTGTVSLVSPIVDPATGTVKVTAEIDSYPEGTRPGDFAQIRVVTARHYGTPLVPSVAVFEEQGQEILYVAEGRKAVRRVVETGFVDGERTEIVGGLEPGELVVVKGQRQLRDGNDIEVLEGPPEVLAALAAAEAESADAVVAGLGEEGAPGVPATEPGKGKGRGGRKAGT